MTEAHAQVASVPQSMEEFAKVSQYLVSIKEPIKQWELLYEQTSAFYSLIEEHEIEVSDAVKTSKLMLGQVMAALRVALQKFEDSIDDYKTRFSGELANAIPELFKNISSAAERLVHEMIQDPKSSPEDVIEYLREIAGEVDGMDGTASRYNSYQGILGTDETSFEQLDDVKKDLAMKRALWEAYVDWDESHDEWLGTRLNALDTDAVGSHLADMKMVAAKAQRALPNNRVAPTLQMSLLEFEDIVPLIQASSPVAARRPLRAVRRSLRRSLLRSLLLMGLGLSTGLSTGAEGPRWANAPVTGEKPTSCSLPPAARPSNRRA